MSKVDESAAEYYRNRDWKQTVKIYKEITTLDCDEWNPVYAPPQEIYQYYAIAYEQMGKFDSAEYVLLDGLQKLPENIELRKDLHILTKNKGSSVTKSLNMNVLLRWIQKMLA